MNRPFFKDVWLYAHPTMDRLASAVEQSCVVSGEAMPDDYRRVKYMKHIRWNEFADGFPNIFIENVKEMAGKDVIFLGSFHSPEVIFEQLSVIYALPRYLARSVTFILPYFPTGTMERVDTEGQIATAKTLATLLSSIPMTARGPPQIMVIDIHALQERFYFSENVIPRLGTAIPLLQRQLELLPEQQNISIAFPDDGAYKRFSSMFSARSTIICAKIRHGDTRIVKVKDGDPKNQHVVIVDDLVQTGGTLLKCAEALMARGAKAVSAYVTHAVFPKNSWQKFVNSTPKFESFWITDSVPHAYDIVKHEPFKLLSLSNIIAEDLLGYDLSLQ